MATFAAMTLAAVNVVLVARNPLRERI